MRIPTPNLIDILSMSGLALSAVRGYVKGLSGEVAHVTGIVAAFAGGIVWFRPLGVWLASHSRLDAAAASAVALAAIVVAIFAVFIVLRHLLGRMMKIVFEPAFNRGAGLVGGLLAACAVLGVIFLLMNLWPHPYLNRKFGSESVLGSFLHRVWPAVQTEPAAHAEPTETAQWQ